jgi:hypothetical protein
MKYTKSFIFITLAAALALSSCSGLPKGSGGGGGGGGNKAKVSLVLVSDTLPANLGIISFKVAITSVVLTSKSGVTSTLDLGALNSGAGLIVDLARAQSDSIFLGTVLNVPTGTDSNSTITVHFTSAQLAFFNGTGAAITNLNPQCPANNVCSVPFTTTGVPVATLSVLVPDNTGFGIDFNLKNAITLTGTSLSVNFSNSGTNNVISAFTLPRQNSNLAAGKLDLIEDFTGVATVTGTSVTIASQPKAGRGSITALSTSTTVFDQDPSQTLCPNGTTQLTSCVASNQAASMDAILNSDGTFAVQEIEPLLASPVVDTVEGTVVSNASNGTQFSIITTDLLPAATNSKIGSLGLGDPVNVTLSSIVTGGFLVDTKGLAVGGAIGNFKGASDTSALHLGQSVAIHITSFTAASGTTSASANTNSVTLRWSRFISTVSIASSPAFTVSALPGYFGFTQASTFQIQTFSGTQGTVGVTNLDGVTSTGNLIQGNPVGVRALFIEDAGNTLNPAFFAAKVRQH